MDSEDGILKKEELVEVVTDALKRWEMQWVNRL